MNGKLTNEDISRALEEMRSFFEKNGAERSYILRMMLAAEEMLLIYRDKFGEETRFFLTTGGMMRVRRCEIRVMCDEYDPAGTDDENRVLRGILSRNELAPRWNYVHRYNRILCAFNKKMTVSGNTWLLIAIIAAIVLGLIAKGDPQGFIGNFCSAVMTPVSSAVMRLMLFFASFMIFWSIITGICSMGDISSFATAGRKLVKRFLGVMLLASLGGTAYLLLRTSLSARGGSGFDAVPVVNMILDIIPSDPFTPFINGNTLQLLFVAFLLGTVLLLLKNKLNSTLPEIFRDLSDITNYILSAIVTLMPVVVFSSLFRLIADNDLTIVVDTLEYPLTALCLFLAAFIVFFVTVCLTRKLRPGILIKKLWPVMQITLSTSSSGAAYLETVNTCEHKLGIDPRLVRIGVPIGPSLISVCKPLTLLAIVCTAFNRYSLPLTVPTVISIALSVLLLGISVPPVPGSMTSVYLILFTSFGIPEEMIAIVLTFDALLDRFGTTIGQATLMMELTQTGVSLGMTDEEVLRRG